MPPLYYNISLTLYKVLQDASVSVLASDFFSLCRSAEMCFSASTACQCLFFALSFRGNVFHFQCLPVTYFRSVSFSGSGPARPVDGERREHGDDGAACSFAGQVRGYRRTGRADRRTPLRSSGGVLSPVLPRQQGEGLWIWR